MMKRNLWIAGLLAVVVLVSAVGAEAFGHGTRGKRMGPEYGERGGQAFWMGLARVVNPLNFTDEQWKKTEDIVGKMQNEMRYFDRAMRGQHETMHDVMQGEKGFDETKAREAIAKARPDFVKLVENLERGRNDLYGMMNPEQQTKLDEIMAYVEEHAAGQGKGARQWGAGRMMERLNLSAEQKEKAEKLFEGSTSKMQGYMQAVLGQWKTERTSLKEGPMTDEQIKASAEKVADVAAEAMLEMGKNHAALWEILTPEQRAEMEKMHDHGKGWGRKR